MKRLFPFILSLIFLLSFAQPALAASSPQTSYMRARVEAIQKQGTQIVGNTKNRFQLIRVRILDGAEKGKTLTIQSGRETTLTAAQIVSPGEEIIVAKLLGMDGKVSYQVYDHYRISSILYLTIIFVLLVFIIAGWKGLGSLLGLGSGLAVILFYIVPSILHGSDPLQVSIYGSLIILFVTTYLAHGVSRQTTVALVSTFVVLMITAWLSALFVDFTHIIGFTEESSTLQFGVTQAINLKGLLLGGIIIGTLGALNDITTTQAAAVFELARTDSRLSFWRLFQKSFGIGREHVVSMVNTLVLAYAGSSLVLFLFLLLNPAHVPLWVIINSEDISDELVRTLAGSMGLILVVPIVTLLATAVCNKDVKESMRNLFHSLS